MPFLSEILVSLIDGQETSKKGSQTGPRFHSKHEKSLIPYDLLQKVEKTRRFNIPFSRIKSTKNVEEHTHWRKCAEVIGLSVVLVKVLLKHLRKGAHGN
jgi:hypothetical protein